MPFVIGRPGYGRETYPSPPPVPVIVGSGVQIVRFAIGTAAVQDSPGIIPGTAIILFAGLDIAPGDSDVPYPEGTTITITNAASGKVLLSADQDNPADAIYWTKPLDVLWGTPARVRATVGNAPAFGSGIVLVEYALP